MSMGKEGGNDYKLTLIIRKALGVEQLKPALEMKIYLEIINKVKCGNTPSN